MNRSVARKIVFGVVLSVLRIAPHAVAQPTMDRVTPLPSPAGRFLVGTTVAYLKDNKRSDREFPNGRPITVQLWYPAARSSKVAGQYLVEPALANILRARHYYGVDSAVLSAWAGLSTHSTIDAPVAKGQHAPTGLRSTIRRAAMTTRLRTELE